MAELPLATMRLATLVLFLSASASAQTPDTTSAWRYVPLAVGDVWEYANWFVTCQSPSVCTTERGGYTRTSVARDSTVDGAVYRLLLDEGFRTNGTPSATSTRLVRFDTLAAHVVTRAQDGEEPWPVHDIACRLDAPFGDTCDPDGLVTVGEGNADTPSGLEGDKRFQFFSSGVVYQRDVGVVYEGGVEVEGSWRELTWARVGGIEYGQAVLARETPSVSRALGVRVWPNAAQGAATVELRSEAPGLARAEVFDTLGRRVAVLWDGPLGAGRTPVSFDAGRLAVGVYVVRLTVGDGVVTGMLRVTR